MWVKVLKNTDVVISGEKKALFAGQVYLLSQETAGGLVKEGKAETIEERAKAVKGPPEDKAIKPSRAKGGE